LFQFFDADVLVDLVYGLVDRAEFDDFAGDVGDKAAIGRAAGGGEFRADASGFLDGGSQRVDQAAARRQEGFCAEFPI
jgi:hypothetical protein